MLSKMWGGSRKIAYSSLPDAVDPLLASASNPGSVSLPSVHIPADLHPRKQLSESSRREQVESGGERKEKGSMTSLEIGKGLLLETRQNMP